MADNVVLNAGSGGPTIRTVAKNTVETPVCVIDIGGAGAEALLTAGQTTMSGSVPVAIASNQTAIAVGGNVAAGVADGGNPVKIGGIYNSLVPVLASGQRGDCQLDASGNLRVNVSAGATGNAAAANTGGSVPSSADYAGLNVGGNLRGQTGANPTGTTYSAHTDLTSVGGASFALGQQLAAGSLPVVLTAAQITALTPVSTVTIGAALPAGTNTLGSVGLVPLAAGGVTPFPLISAASTNATSVKASAGQLYGYAAMNAHATAFRYLKFYNKASSPTVGTDTPVLVVALPPMGGANLDLSSGVAFGTGLALAITTGMANNDTGAVGAAEVVVNVTYK